MQKPILWLYTNNEHVNVQIKNIIPLMSTQKVKYLVINLIKYIQDLYAETTKYL